MGRTRLGVVADGVLEGGWLAIAATVPLYFNALDLRGFEPDKAALLRCLAAVVLAAWLVKAFEAGRASTGSLRPSAGEPLVAAMLFFAAAVGIAVFASISPVESLVGSYERAQGLSTIVCYVVVGLAVAANLRSWAQVERLADVMVLASVPVALYALAQAADLDPFEWTSTAQRAGSTQGNAVFLGAVLCMVVPLTLARLSVRVDSLRGRGFRPAWSRGVAAALALVSLQVGLLALYLWIGANDVGWWWAAQPVLGLFLALGLLTTTLPRTEALRIAGVAGLAAALVLQLAALVVSGSRGPWLGLFAGCAVAAFALGVRSPTRAVRLAAPAGLVAVAAVVLALNLLADDSSGRSSTYLRPFTQLLHGGSSNDIRRFVWEGSLDLVARHPAATSSDSELAVLRPLVGYGPEEFRDAYNQVYQPELARAQPGAVPDRAHNGVLDALVATGVLGLVAYLLVFHVFFARALEWLGLVRPGSVRRVRVLLAGLLGFVVAHFVETQVGFGLVATLSYAWLAFGVLAGAAPRGAGAGGAWDAAARPPVACRVRRGVVASTP